MQRIPSAAAQKAPVAAFGFQVQCNKWAIIVCLLLVEVPERTIFMQNGMDQALRPSFELTNVGLGSQYFSCSFFPYNIGLSAGWTKCRMQIQ